jgi:hypothetical protein
MTRLLGGPAEGISLELQRSPLFLRVTYDQHSQKWDALDQLDDEAFDGEKLFVYRQQGKPGYCHVDGRDKKTGKRYGRSFAIAEYAFWEHQPPQDLLASNERWQAWVLETIDLEGPRQ